MWRPRQADIGHVSPKDRYLKIRRFPLWLLPLLVGLALMPMRGVRTSPDSAWYLSTALNLEQHGRYLDSQMEPAVARGPVFPLLIAASFWLLGTSVKSAFWVVRLFSVFNGLLVYGFAARLFGRAVGLVSSLLVLTSLTLQSWSARVLLDHIQPFFVVAAILLVFIAFERRSLSLFGMSGFILGVAFLTKESAALFFPLPLALWLLIPTYRFKGSYKGLLLFAATSAALVTLWFSFTATHLHGEDPVAARGKVVIGSLMGGSDGPASEAPPLGQQPRRWVEMLARYYLRYLRSAVPYSPLLILAWLYLVARALLRGCHSAITLLVSLACFAPLILYLGNTPLRLGQNFLVYLFSYVALAVLLIPGSREWHSRRALSVFRLAIMGVFLASQLLFGHGALKNLFAPGEPGGYAPGIGVYGFRIGGAGWEVSGWHGDPVRQAGAWFLANTGPSEPILMDWYWADGLFFCLEGRQPIYPITYVHSKDVSHSFMSAEESAARPSTRSPLFVWMQGGRIDPRSPDTLLVALSESQVVDQVRRLGIRYVVISPLRHFLYLYLESNPGFEEVARFGDGQLVVFRRVGQVRELRAEVGREKVAEGTGEPRIRGGHADRLEAARGRDFTLMVGRGVSPYLHLLKQHYPVRFRVLREGYFERALGLDSMVVTAIEEGRLPGVELGHRYTEKEYAEAVRRRGNAAVREEVERFEQASMEARDNPWPHLALAHLYLVEDNLGEAREVLGRTKERDLEGLVRFSYARAWASIGSHQIAVGDGRGAVRSLEQALALGARDPQARQAVLQGYRELGPAVDTSLKQRLLSNYLERVGRLKDDLRACLDVGDVYADRGQAERALDIYSEAAERWPDEGLPHLHSARVLRGEGRVDEAIQQYKRSVELSPTLGDGYRELSALYRAGGQMKKAIDLYRRAASRMPALAWPHIEVGRLLLLEPARG